MAGLFGMRVAQTRTGVGVVELALDMTAEAITLYERAASGGWRKFAGAPLDDPEFQIVIGLVRSEAEKRCGGKHPIRLWLPSDQVLQRRTRLSASAEDARLAEAFQHIEAQTVFRPEDVAIAVSPDEPDGEATILITFAETWREARVYAERWGFLPGEVSTRHRAGAFGADGPVFRLRRTPKNVPVNPRRLGGLAAFAGLGAGAAAAAASIWMLMPLAQPPVSTTPASSPEVGAGVNEVATSTSTPAADVPVPPKKPSHEQSVASIPLDPPNPNAVSLEESLLALKGSQAAPAGTAGSSRSLPEPILSAVFRAVPNEAPFDEMALNTAEAAAIVQGTSPTPVQMAPWADLPKAPMMVAEALAPRLPHQPDPAGQEPDLPPVTAPAQPAIPLASSAPDTDASNDVSVGAAEAASERLAFRQPGSMGSDGPAPASPPEAPFTEAAPPVVTIIPAGSNARLPVPMPRVRPGPGTNSKVPVVAGPPATPTSPEVRLPAAIGAASTPPGPAILLQPDPVALVPLTLAGPPAVPFAEAAPPVVTIIPPGSTATLPVPIPPARPGPLSNSTAPAIAAAPTIPAAPSATLLAEIGAAAVALDSAVIRQPSLMAKDQSTVAGPPEKPIAEAEPPEVTIIPPGSTASLPVPMPPSRPGSETPAPAGPAATAPDLPDAPGPDADQAGADQLDHEKLVQQLAASAIDLGEDLAGLALPPQRPASVAESAGAAETEPGLAATKEETDNLASLTLPPPRPDSIRADTKPVADTLPADPANLAPSQASAVALIQDPQLSAAANALPPDPNAPTELAALSAPKPPTRPARPLLPVKLPSTSLLPALGGSSSAKVRSAATEEGLPLDRTALIGVLNLDGGRKALLRMPDGRYKSVIVGDLVDGWRVSAIGVDAMKFSKSGQDMTLQLVNR